MPHQTIFDYLAVHLRERPDAPVYLHQSGALSFRNFHDRAARLGGALKNHGIAPGDRVAMLMQDSPALVVSLLATMGIGAIAVPCNTMLEGSDLEHVLANCGARALVTAADHIEIVEAIKPNLPDLKAVFATMEAPPAGVVIFEDFQNSANPVDLSAKDGPAFIIYTSGSTGRPKGALHHHSDIVCSLEAMGRGVYEITPEDRLFSAPRLSFAYGFGNSFAFPIGLGAPCALLSERPLPAAIAEVFKRHRPTVFFGVPAVFRNILEYRRQGGSFDPGDLKFSAAGGENLPAQTFNEWKDFTGTPILETIGSTELLHGYISNLKSRIRLGSSGLTVKGYEIRLVNESGEDSDRGILHVKGGSAFHQYWNDPEKTAEALKDGWVRTGDVYRRDDDGFFFYEGRADDMFKSSGNWVSPVEIEDVLRQHPAIQEAAIVGLPAPDGTFAVTAFISLRPVASSHEEIISELNALAASSLPRYKRPRDIRILPELPRNPTGKVLRFKLRA